MEKKKKQGGRGPLIMTSLLGAKNIGGTCRDSSYHYCGPWHEEMGCDRIRELRIQPYKLNLTLFVCKLIKKKT